MEANVILNTCRLAVIGLTREDAAFSEVAA